MADFLFTEDWARQQALRPVASCFLPDGPAKAARVLEALSTFRRSANLLEAQPTISCFEDCQRRLEALSEAIRGRVRWTVPVP